MQPNLFFDEIYDTFAETNIAEVLNAFYEISYQIVRFSVSHTIVEILARAMDIVRDLLEICFVIVSHTNNIKCFDLLNFEEFLRMAKF